MNKCKLSTKYSCEIPMDKFVAILDKDKECHWDDSLAGKLNAIEGIIEVDYNGHFGNSLYFDVADKNDNTELWNRISEEIKEYGENDE